MKNKLFLLVTILLFLTLIGPAALCNSCGITPATESKSTDASESKAGGMGAEKTKEDLIKEQEEKAKLAEMESIQERDAKIKQEAIESEQQASAATESGETTSSNAAAPTIRLQIYEGPTYSEAGDICLYRIEAIVTGNPTPNVTFSRDDSSGTWGPNKVQINIQRSQVYTLTATATNSAGSASASINLSWGCGSNTEAAEETPYEESGGESGPSILSMAIPCVVSEGGNISTDFSRIEAGTNPFVGDNPANRTYACYISYDITVIPTPNVHTASMTFNVDNKLGDLTLYTSLGVFSLYYGPVPISTANFSLDHNLIQYIDSTTSGNFTIDNEQLKTELQNAINAGQSRFQIEIYPLGPDLTDYNNDFDGITWNPNGITLNITYLY